MVTCTLGMSNSSGSPAELTTGPVSVTSDPMRLFRSVRVIRTVRQPPVWLARLRRLLTVAVLISLGTILLESGYGLALPRLLALAIRTFDYLVLGLFAADVLLGYLFAPSRSQHLRRRWPDLVVLTAVIVSLLMHRLGIVFVALRQTVVVGQEFARSRRFAGIVEQLRLQPVQLLALSFLALIIVGTVFLTFPASTRDGRGASLLDALFTATSAVCVTGLIVKDTPVFFSRFGQMVILALIQLGALGIMTFYASLAAIFSRRLGLFQRKTVSDMVEETRDIDIIRALRYILLLTLLAESAGTVLLFVRWLPEFGDPLQALYVAGFHSVSAFCNAGFSVFSNSLEAYRTDPSVCLPIMALIIAGGLGFSVVHELVNRENVRRGPAFALRRLTVHARLVLWTSGILVTAGTVFFFFFEYDNALAGLPVGGKLLAALFQSVTPRTAGFNTVPLAGLKPATVLLWSVLMFIGASPGGTGGGIKTSTAAVLFLAVRDRILGREDVEIGRRTIPKDIVYRASSIAAVSVGIVTFFFTILLLTQRAPFQDILFETLSAFGTVGLSTGLTPNLDAVGKLAIIMLMYVGRLGPLTLALAMRTHQSKLPISYPDARIMVG